MKALNYIYYKLYKIHLKGSIKEVAEWAAVINVVILVFLNLFVIGYLYFLFRNRYKTIVSKYETESDRERKLGNLIVAIYIIVSFLLIFPVGFFKPGKM